MSILILLVTLAGAVLGLRFKVFVLAPAICFVIVAVLAMGIGRGNSLAAMLLVTLLALISLQIGYIGGVLTRYTMNLARAGAQRKASLEAESAH